MHLKRIRWPGILLGASAIAAITTVWAQSGGGYDASFNAVDSAGQTLGGDGYVLQTGVGQPIAGTSGGGGYSLDIGVLAGGAGAAATGTPTASPSPSPSATASPSPSPSVTPGAEKRWAPALASDGVY